MMGDTIRAAARLSEIYATLVIIPYVCFMLVFAPALQVGRATMNFQEIPLYTVTLKTTPPWGNGHFMTGITWAFDNLAEAQQFVEQEYATLSNYTIETIVRRIPVTH